MTNVRFHEGEFILLDLESFQEKPRDDMDLISKQLNLDPVAVHYGCVLRVTRLRGREVYTKISGTRMPLQEIFGDQWSLARYIYYRGVANKSFRGEIPFPVGPIVIHMHSKSTNAVLRVD
eukprot:GHVR01123693.1.p1 GENE.GHVR01123693.1~~GHVR01123693.1.p1  ORF type:complete len:120 (+),score=1.42 GHVR01123693.1:238-597(+)